MKKTDTWMPLYVTDYLGDTMHLTTEQHGAYFLMLMASWKTGGTLPSDDASLGAITRLGTAFKKSRAVLVAFFQVDGHTMTHKRVVIELQKAQAMSEARSEAGKKAMANRWTKDQQSPLQTDNSVITKPVTKAQQDPLQTDIPSPSPSPIPIGIIKPKGFIKANKKPETPLPENFGISPEVAQWAAEKRHNHLAERLEDFIGKATAKGYRYVDWDAAFKNAIRGDWAGLNKPQFVNQTANKPQSFRERDAQIAADRVATVAPNIAAKSRLPYVDAADFIEAMGKTKPLELSHAA